MTDRYEAPLIRRIEELACSGDYEGFNAIVGALAGSFDDTAIDVIKRDAGFRHQVTEACQTAWQRKHE